MVLAVGLAWVVLLVVNRKVARRGGWQCEQLSGLKEILLPDQDVQVDELAERDVAVGEGGKCGPFERDNGYAVR